MTETYVPKRVKKIIHGIIEKNCSNIDEEDLIDFLTQELINNFNGIENENDVENILGEHIGSFALSHSQEIKAPDSCRNIFDDLEDNDLIGKIYDEEEEEEEEEEFEEEEDGVEVGEGEVKKIISSFKVILKSNNEYKFFSKK
eukprot:TRINITY_DN550_c5_g1_i2.p1 TRINITY_DN550_c5_g1~~TRINITY_DN550_c5_g1_i2.p1  ORF type:complete len:143 (-),score=53.87 TRINITY_DN550_c5_g1_i2:499-927(-)